MGGVDSNLLVLERARFARETLEYFSGWNSFIFISNRVTCTPCFKKYRFQSISTTL